MKSFVTILAASAVLTASLCAGLAATAKPSAPIPAAAAAQPAATTATPSTWVEPPAKADTACRDAAWPYRSTVCAVKAAPTVGEAPARRVRVIPTAAAPAALALR